MTIDLEKLTALLAEQKLAETKKKEETTPPPEVKPWEAMGLTEAQHKIMMAQVNQGVIEAEKKAKTENYFTAVKDVTGEQEGTAKTINNLLELGYDKKVLEQNPEILAITDPKELQRAFIKKAGNMVEQEAMQAELAKFKGSAHVDVEKGTGTKGARGTVVPGSDTSGDEIDFNNPAHLKKLTEMGISRSQIKALALANTFGNRSRGVRTKVKTN